MRYRATVIIGVAMMLWTEAGYAAPMQFPEYFPVIARKFARQFPSEHLLRIPLNDSVSASAWTNYLGMLDYERMYFTGEDLARFRTRLNELDDQVEVGDISFAYEVYDVFRTRVADRAAFVKKLLEREPDLTIEESYHWKRKDADWAKDAAEWDDLWRRKIKNEYVLEFVRRKLADEKSTNSVTSAVEPGLDIEPAKTVESALEAIDTAVVSTNAMVLTPSTSTAAVSTNPPPPIRDAIIKRYEQLTMVYEDSDPESVLQRFLSSFSRAYDPHSEYMSPSSKEDFDIDMKLSLVGIGAILTSEDGAAKIERMIKGGPADKDVRDIRLKPGDKIVGVQDEGGEKIDTLHWPLQKVVRRIRGEKGTRVFLTVVPATDPSGTTTKIVDLVRDEVKLEEQAASWSLKEMTAADGKARRIAVVVLPAFYANMEQSMFDASESRSCSYDVEKILVQVATSRVDGLLLDLRNNGGGALIEAVKMTGLFIAAGPVVQVKESHSPTRVLTDTDPRIAYNGPMCVLVNRLSASASEIVAAALQDYGRAVIIGDTKTHGKGSVQVIQDLGRDKRLGTMRVTNAGYYRINGESTQLKGVVSDIVVPSPFDVLEFGEEYMPHAMVCAAIGKSNYSKLGDLESRIALLKQASARRTESDPDFLAYHKLLERVERVSKTEELPLDAESRRKLVQTEDEVASAQDEYMGEGGNEGEEKKGKRDLVLDEAAHIVADLADAERGGRPAPVVVTPVPNVKSTVEELLNWLRNL